MHPDPSITASELTRLCERLIAELEIGGAQIAIASADTVVHAEAGVANADFGSPVTADTVFQIGSTTKVLTAVLLFRLAERGLLDVDGPVSEQLPGVRLAAGDQWRTITPRQLMSMSSGLDNGPYLDTGRGDDCVARYVDAIADIPLVFEPGTAYGYSNASTVVSGLLVERLTGLNWDDALRELFLDPADLREAVSLFDELPYHRVAVGALPGRAGALKPWQFGRGMGPTGSTLAMSARDLARVGRLFLDHGAARSGAQLFEPKSAEQMQVPQISVPARLFADDWCAGPYRKVWGGVSVFGHSGTTENGGSTLLWIPESNVSIATTVNTPARGYHFADAVFDAVLRDRFHLAKPHRPDAAKRVVDPERYAGIYGAWGATYEVVVTAGRLHVTLTDARPDDSRAALHPPVSSELIPIGSHRFLPADDALTEHHRWDVAFSLGPDGRPALLHNGAFTARRRT